MSDKNWLVRSGGRILGPFDQSTLTSMLQTREISLHDEVAGPQQYWKTILDKKEFSGVVSNLKNFINESETKTTNLDSSYTHTLTEKLDLNVTDELTEEVSINTIKTDEIVYENVQDEPSPPRRDSDLKPVKQFGFQASDKAVLGAEKVSSRLWRTASIGALSLGILLAGYYFVLKPTSEGRAFEGQFSKGKELLDIGLYASAWSLFEKAYVKDPSDSRVPIYLGALRAQLSSDTVESEELLLSTSVRSNDKEKKMLYSSLAVLELRRSNWLKAESWLDRSTAIDANYIPALLNYAWVYLNEKKFVAAKKSLEKVIKLGGEPAVSNYLYALVLTREYESGGSSKDALRLARAQASKVIKRGEFLSAEASLLNLYIDSLLVGAFVSKQPILKHLNMDPYFSEKFRYNLFVSQGFRDGKYLYNICNSVKQKITSMGLKKSFLALCHLKAGRVDQAQMQILGALDTDPKNAVYNSIDALVKKQQKLDVEASVAVGNALKNNENSDLPYILQISFCKSTMSVACVIENSQMLLSQNSKSIEAKEGLAWGFHQNNNRPETTRYISEVLRKTNDYIPVLSLYYEMRGR